MSEIKTLDVEVSFPDVLDVDVDFGQTLTKIVAPEHYMGPFEFHVSDEDQVIPVKDKTPVEDICVKGITSEKTITENGTYNTLEDKTITVDVNPDLRPLSVSENGTYQPDGFDGFSEVAVNNPAQWTSKGLAEWTEPYGDINLGDATSVNEYAFYKRKEILSFTAKHATTIGNAAFTGLTKLTEIHLPRATSMPLSFLGDCSSLTVLYLPSATLSFGYAVSGCTSLHTAIFCKLSTVWGAVFNNCRLLKTLVLGNSAVCNCNDVNSFNNTPFASGGSGGDIYIPKTLYDHLGDGSNLDYLSNPRWNTLNSYGTITWHPIEGSEYETYMPGGAKYEEEMALT